MNIPFDLENHIIKNYLDIKSILNLKKTCKKYYDIIDKAKFDFSNRILTKYVFYSIYFHDINFIEWLVKNNYKYDIKHIVGYSLMISNNINLISYLLNKYGICKINNKIGFEIYIIKLREKRMLITDLNFIIKLNIFPHNIKILLLRFFRYKHLRYKYNSVIKSIIINYYMSLENNENLNVF